MKKYTLSIILIAALIWITACNSNVETEKNTVMSNSSENSAVITNTEKTVEINEKADSGQTDKKTETPEKDTDKESKEKPNESADSAKRIKFPKDATETIVNGNMAGFEDERVFLIELRADQTFKVEDVGSNPVSVYVSDSNGKNVNDMDLSCHGKFNLDKTVAGDYKIRVTECKKADPWKGEFKLKVTAVDN